MCWTIWIAVAAIAGLIVRSRDLSQRRDQFRHDLKQVTN